MTSKIWLVDFDDTLATGPVTWGYQHALPKLIEAHGLPVDPVRFNRSLLAAQELSNQTMDLDAILHGFFQEMNWPAELEQSLLRDVLENYRPQLFEDTTAFLSALHVAGQTVVVLSNNPRAPQFARDLGLDAIVDDVITPHMLPGARPKPDRSFWDRVMERLPAATGDNAIMVGDDPWSDLAFAQECGLHAWLLDRYDRFADVDLGLNMRRVRTLLEIEVT
ncbi:HAD family hydrolase [Aggregatilinea lenta]|uniref:HAD family hydrolase n=1 Tax=Aggregatilinea lenta TaxID=913108 RepID=UPI000E5B1A7E|nr:HAD family hydrolase [Aggregatilinea lenta]